VGVRLTAAQAVVRFLAAQHSERDGRRRRAVPAIFGIFGHGNVCGLGQALAQDGVGLPFHQPKHEQAMVHTALGYAKAQRRLATLACTASIGPGATNLVTGAATATTNRLPVLLLPGDTYATRRQGPVLQQLQHPGYADWTVNECLRPVSRFFDRIVRPEQLLTALPEAMQVLLDPAATGAVTIAMSQDVQGEAYDFPDELFAERVWHVPRAPAEPERLAAAAELLRGARRPLVIAGGGVRHSEAEAALAALADGCGLPVAETSAGKGVYHGDLALGGIGVNGTRAANAIAAEADVVLCAGTRLTDFTTASRSLFQHPEVRFVGLNVAAADAHRMRALALVADARAGLEALRDALGGWQAAAGLRDEVRAARRAWEDELAFDLDRSEGEAMSQGQALRALNAAARPGDWVVAAAGSPPGDLLKLWRCPPGSFAHLEFGFSCMGHELPAGLGIRMAEPEAGEVYVVIGDGTYLMAPTELVTAVQERLKVTVIVFVNGGYQSIHALQRSTLGTSFGNEFRVRRPGDVAPAGAVVEVDYAVNARSLGCAAWTVRDLDELSAALEEARDEPGPALIACHVDPLRAVVGAEAWWDLGVPEVADDGETAWRAASHAEGRKRQRYLG
jgi:3D-(3,5/4)-trihydroxycyclohexane-1,2-dione acylhydrolase (decyclizing)